MILWYAGFSVPAPDERTRPAGLVLRQAEWFFFFQAEDGIRDIGVTGVQTCALPISGNAPSRPRSLGDPRDLGLDGAFPALFLALLVPQLAGTRARVAALLGGGIALALIPLTPAGTPIVDRKSVV